MAARYTEDQRQQVLEMLRSNRFDVAHIARELGISRQTIYNWIDESGDENLLKMPNVSRMTRLTSQVAESHQSEPDYINDEAYLLSGLANPTRADAVRIQLAQMLNLVKLLLPGIEAQMKDAPFKDQINTLCVLTDVTLKINRILPRESEADSYYA